MIGLWPWVAVTIAAPQLTAEGVSLHLASGATVTAEAASLNGKNVQGQRVGVVDGQFTIRADSTQLSLDATKGAFEGNVHAVRGDLSFWADRVDVEFGPDGEVLQASAKGRVKAVQGARRAEGESATFKSGRLVLSGRPIVRQGGNEMVGEQIIFKVGQKTIECIQCTMRVSGELRP